VCDMNRPIKLTCDVMNKVTGHSFIRRKATFKSEHVTSVRVIQLRYIASLNCSDCGNKLGNVRIS
jgi:hypothetical protein